ncbi:MAG: HEAT repeat domain-containing protein [Myxococcales bacterium]
MQVSVEAGRRLGTIAIAALSLMVADGCKPTPQSALEHGRSQEAKTRTRGVQELVELGEAGIPGLISLLAVPAAQPEARAALVKLDRPAVAPLIALIGDAAQSKELRNQAVNLLGELKAAEAIAPLVGLLADADLGEPAGWALASIGPAAVEPLATALGDAGVADVGRSRAAGTLATLKTPRAIEALLAAMKSQAPEELRAEVLRGLARTDDPRARQAVLDGLNDRSEEVRKAAFDLLAKKPDPDAFDALVRLLQDDAWRESAAKALGQLRDPRGYERMGELLAREDLEGRQHLLVGLAVSGDPQAIPVAARSLRSWDLGTGAHEVMVRLGWKPGTPEEQTLSDLAKRDKKALLERWDLVGPLLLADLKSKSAEARINAARWLILLGKEETVKPLLAALDATNDELLAHTLAWCGLPPLVKGARAWAARRHVELKSRDDLPPIVWNRPPPD